MDQSKYASSLVNPSWGPAHITNGLHKSAGTVEVIASLAAYAHWSAKITAGVANLVASLTTASDLFGNDSETEVAKFVFYALTDEFGTGYSGVTHQRIARRMVEIATASLPLISQSEVTALSKIKKQASIKSSQRIWNGYGDRRMHEAATFRALGFHLASETLAALEFQVIDQALSADFPELKDHLLSTRFEENGRSYPAYSWIKIHTHVEEQHRDFAVQAINLALSSYIGVTDKALLVDWVREGFANFVEIQQTAMDAIFTPRNGTAIG